MMKKNFLIPACIIILFFCNKIFAQDTITITNYTLQQCIDIAIKNNPDVKQAEFMMQGDKVRWQQQKASMYPSVSAGVFHSLYNGKSINPFTNTYINQQNTTASYQLSASVTLWSGFSIQNFIREYALNYEAGKMDWQQAKDQLTINVMLDYLAVLNEQEQLKIANEQVAVTQEQVNKLKLENKNGAISPADLYKMQGQLGSDQLAILNTKSALEQAKLSLAQLMNISYTSQMKLQQINEDILLQSYSPTVNEIYQSALKNLAIIKAASLHKQSAQKEVKATRGLLFPTLSLSGGLNTNYSSVATTSQLISTSDEMTDNYVLINNSKSPVFTPVPNYNNLKIPYSNQVKNNLNSSISLDLSIPIFSGLQRRSNVKLSQIDVKQATFHESTVKIQLRQAIERDYLNMTTAYETFKTLLQQVQDYNESFRSAQIKFDAGAISSVDYVIAKNDLDRARINLIAAKYNYILQTKVLDYYQGRPVQ